QSAARTRITPMTAGGIAEANRILAELFAGLSARTSGRGNGQATLREVDLDMRYVGQEHFLTVRAPSAAGRLTASAKALQRSFTRDYERTFRHTIDEPVEIVNLRATVRTPLPRRAGQAAGAGDGGVARTLEAYSFTRGAWLPFRVAHREALAHRGRSLAGPRSCSSRPPRPTSTPSSSFAPAPPAASSSPTRATAGTAEVDPTPERVVYRAGAGSSVAADADPITAEVIRHGLNAAADRMKRALVRTAVTPVIYEVLDFAVAIYDHEVRLLAQAPSLPLFMGTLNFCVEGVIEAVGGVEQLEPGDIVLYNVPYAAGSHPQ